MEGTITRVPPGFALLPALLLSMVGSVGAQDPLGSYDKVQKIAVGGEGGWDFLEVDPAATGSSWRAART